MNKYLTDYLNFLKSVKNYSDHTVRNYSVDINQFLEDISDIDDISRSTIYSFLAKISDKSARTRRRKLSSIKSFTSFLKAEGIIKENPALELEGPKVEKTLPKIMSYAQVDSIINSIDSYQDRAILEILYGTGCRIAELVSIKIANINYEDATIKVMGKGSKERVLPANKDAILSIKKHLETRNYNSEYLFSTSTHPEKHMTDRNARNRVYKYTNGEYSPHKFRHSYATHLVANGAGIEIVKELLGHADISTTTIYTHLANEQVNSAYHKFHPRG